jgi:coenzyme F420 hydrogenase subunit beta
VDSSRANKIPTAPWQADREIGVALEIWEGYAADPELRFKGSSGGILSALSLYCLEHEGMGFVSHTGMDESKPWTNKTVTSRTRQELLSRTASRYAPASPCEGLGAIEASRRPAVFIGKPCDASAVMSLRRERPQLHNNLGLVLTFFCAGTPSTRGTLDLISDFGTPLNEVKSVRYRGEGWPGLFKVSGKDDKTLTYNESWGKLTNYRPFRCHLCPDGLGRVADIACGDAWEEYDGQGNSDPGRSILLVRTERGREILHRAQAAGYVELHQISAENVFRAQHNLLNRRRDIYGRLLAMKMLAVPTPRFRGYFLAGDWLRLAFPQKVRTVFGTLRRLVTRGLWRRKPLRSEIRLPDLSEPPRNSR